MAEFQKVIQEFDRMCQYYGGDCEKCPINQFQINAMTHYKCGNFLYQCPDIAEDLIIKWPHTHPVPPPVYPTIGEVLRKICMLMNIDPRISINTLYDERLTKEAADYLGIVPINENTLKSKV